MDKEEKIVLSIDYAKIIQEDETLCLAEVDLLHTGKNRNQSIITKESVLASLGSFYNKPLVAILNSEVKSMATDFKSHAKTDYDESQRILVGVIPSAEVSNPRWIIDDDGYERLRMNVLLWKYYATDTIRILSEKDGKSKVSIEMLPLSSHKDSQGVTVVDKFEFLGMSFLGEKITEAMVNSKLEVIKFSLDDTIAQSKEFGEKQKSDLDIYDKIKKKKGEIRVKLEHKLLENRLWALLSGYMYERDGYTNHKYYIEGIYDSHIVVRDNETNEDVKFKYSTDNEGKVHIDMTSRKLVDREKEVRTYSKEDIATKEPLKVDNDTISDDSWGSIDKANLRKRVIEAKNFLTIAKDVFLDLREGWENGETSKLKYPIRQLDGDTLIYNRGALASAKGYAEKNKEEEVLNKLKTIYKHLKLDFEADDEDCKKCGNECDEEDYSMKEQPKIIEKAEVKEDIEKENVEQMSANANVDASAQQEFLDIEAKDNAEKAKEQNDLVIAEKIKGFEAKIAEYEKELTELRNYKLAMEEKQKLFKMEEVLMECKDDLKIEKINEFKKSACKYSLADIGLWANEVRAEAFKTAKQKTVSTFQRMDVWEQHTEQSQSKKLWDCAK